MPIRLSSALGSQQEADAFAWAADHGADVISCSWGPADGKWFDPNDPLHNQSFPLPASTKLAIDYATNQGRNGKGCVIFFAAGNGNEKVDNDGYASYERVIAVAACGDRGIKSVYSDFGKAIWCAFPSSDFGFEPANHPEPLTTGIWTTDRVGARGYNPGDLRLGDADGLFTNDFGGTSSACPGAAGVAALILSINPDLKWQDVRDVIRRACDKIDPSGGGYDTNGRSSLYGFGRINAETASLLAKPVISNKVTISRMFNLPLPDLKTVSASLDIGDSQKIDSISVVVEIAHTYIGDLVVTLVPPPHLRTGNIILHNRRGGATNNIKKSYDIMTTPSLSKLNGKAAQGRWTIQIQDKAFRDIGTLVSFGLELTFLQPEPRTRKNGSRSAVKKTARKTMKRKTKT
jgi:subtilisin-like proprotein convertase family protein